MVLSELKKIVDDLWLIGGPETPVETAQWNYNSSTPIKDFVIVRNDNFVKLVLTTESITD